MNENIDLIKILENCPRGEIFWSPLFGDVKFELIAKDCTEIYVKVGKECRFFNADGTIAIGGITSQAIMLYPSKDQMDWSKFEAPWYKREKFDLKMLRPFDKVIARIDKYGFWCCELFSFIEEGTNLVKCCGAYYKYCVPYNKDTVRLIGTADEAPEHYRYWDVPNK